MSAEQASLQSLARPVLGQLSTHISVPSYEPAQLSAGIVHIGVGNFHRAHQAWYLHRLMQQGKALDWAIWGAGVRAQDAAMRDKLVAQDCLTTLIELAPETRRAEIIGSMLDYVPISSDHKPLIEAMCQPQIRIVATTITEGGYYIDPASGAFDAAHPDMQHDAQHPDAPRTAFGAILAALDYRRSQGLGPFTLMSCDNLQGNGAIFKQTVLGLAQRQDLRLAAWIEANVSFPNSMVDCIVPATGASTLELAQSLGVDDAAPVAHENFRQWVLEDKFCAGRPEWEAVGVTFTDQVHAYEAMKIRVLNAGHQVLANAGELLGLPTIDACMQDPDVSAFFQRVQTHEILPYVQPIGGVSPADYLGLIQRRFANPAIGDTTRRVAFDGSSRHTGFVLPILRDALAVHGRVSGLALVEALWARMCTGQREDGSSIQPNDPHWDALQACAHAAQADPAVWLAQDRFYGSLNDAQPFASAFAKWLKMLHNQGCRATLQAYCASGAA